MPTKTILFVTSNIWSVTGGSEVLWSGAAEEILKRGYRISIALPEIQGAMSAHPMLRKMGARFYCYPAAWPSFWSRVRSRISGQDLKYRPLTVRPDLVVISQGKYHDGIDWARECARVNLPFVTISQAVRIEDWPSDDRADSILSTFSKARQNFFVSHGNLRDVEKYLGGKVSPATVIHNAPAMENRSILPWPETQGGFHLACVGRLVPLDKGQDILFEALNQRKWRERPLKVRLYGTGSRERILLRLRDAMNLQELVTFCGSENILNVWRENHGLVLPSRSEGFALSLIEAFWCGRFAIVSNVADNGLLVDDGINGCLMEAVTPESLDSALERAWSNRDRWQEWGQRAHEKIAAFAPSNPVGELANSILEYL